MTVEVLTLLIKLCAHIPHSEVCVKEYLNCVKSDGIHTVVWCIQNERGLKKK